MLSLIILLCLLFLLFLLSISRRSWIEKKGPIYKEVIVRCQEDVRQCDPGQTVSELVGYKQHITRWFFGISHKENERARDTLRAAIKILALGLIIALFFPTQRIFWVDNCYPISIIQARFDPTPYVRNHAYQQVLKKTKFILQTKDDRVRRNAAHRFKKNLLFRVRKPFLSQGLKAIHNHIVSHHGKNSDEGLNIIFDTRDKYRNSTVGETANLLLIDLDEITFRQFVRYHIINSYNLRLVAHLPIWKEYDPQAVKIVLEEIERSRSTNPLTNLLYMSQDSYWQDVIYESNYKEILLRKTRQVQINKLSFQDIPDSQIHRKAQLAKEILQNLDKFELVQSPP